MRRLLTLAGIIAIFGLLAACSGDSDGSGGDLVPQDPNDGALHILPSERGSGYSVTPATSGEHWLSPVTPAGVPAPARWGIYEVELPNEVLVHNLEHGGIGIHYDCPDGCDELVSQLEGIVPANPSQFIVSPYSGMESRIAITAWRRHLFLEEFDEDQINEFINAYQDEAPESVPGNLY